MGDLWGCGEYVVHAGGIIKIYPLIYPLAPSERMLNHRWVSGFFERHRQQRHRRCTGIHPSMALASAARAGNSDASGISNSGGIR